MAISVYLGYFNNFKEDDNLLLKVHIDNETVFRKGEKIMTGRDNFYYHCIPKYYFLLIGKEYTIKGQFSFTLTIFKGPDSQDQSL